VGADRGQFSIYLANHNHNVIAIENKKGPYLNLEKSIKEEGLLHLSCVLADGLDYLPSEVDCCCILGMGGSTIYDILSRHEDRLKQFKSIIIEPQSCASQAISYLLSLGFENDAGLYVYEKRYYPLLRFVPSAESQKYSSLDEKYGPYPVRMKDPLLLEMLEKHINQLEPYQDQEETKKKYDILVADKRGIFDL
jgi:tRNA A22 N-methylase